MRRRSMPSDTSTEELALHPLERRILSELLSSGEMSLQAIAEKTGLDRGAVAKAAKWLSQKDLVVMEERLGDRYASLGPEGEVYALHGLPERRLVEVLRELGGAAGLGALRASGLSEQEIRIGIIWAKKNGWVAVLKSGQETVIELASYPGEKTGEEIVLERLKEGGRIALRDLGPHADACNRLARRPGVLEVREEKIHILRPTGKAMQLGERLGGGGEVVSQLTPELILSGRWREVELSRYDLTAPVKPAFAARRNPLSRLIEVVSDAFVEMGFEEIRGPLVELAFWNFDALFQPQDHPAREMHDTFYVEAGRRGRVPEGLAARIARVHRDGGGTGSMGWGYRWRIEEAERLLLRTHTTATTIRHLAAARGLPIKVFSIDRVYRNEKVDWKHLAELHQIEGILVDRGVTFRNLMGIIKEFYARIGIRDIRFRPSYFPYTEPSAEVEVFFPEQGAWTELGGMGIFRPEVTLPLGVKEPVLAWGLGLERLAMAIHRLDDIRTLYRNDLSWIRHSSKTDFTLLLGRR